MAATQNFKNHTRLDPLFHFFIMPALVLNLVFAIWVTVKRWPLHLHLFSWWIVMALVVVLLALTTRMYALKVQDRVIRLEERLRLASLLPAAGQGTTPALTESQWVALRFASDRELPALAQRAATEGLTGKQVKENITDWRADHYRV